LAFLLDRGQNEDFSLWRSKSEIKFRSEKIFTGISSFSLCRRILSEQMISTVPFKIKTWYDTAQINFSSLLVPGLKFGHQVYMADNYIIGFFIGFLGFGSRDRKSNAD